MRKTKKKQKTIPIRLNFLTLLTNLFNPVHEFNPTIFFYSDHIPSYSSDGWRRLTSSWWTFHLNSSNCSQNHQQNIHPICISKDYHQIRTTTHHSCLSTFIQLYFVLGRTHVLFFQSPNPIDRQTPNPFQWMIPNPSINQPIFVSVLPPDFLLSQQPPRRQDNKGSPAPLSPSPSCLRRSKRSHNNPVRKSPRKKDGVSWRRRIKRRD